jgi:hypothetical protein
MQDLIFVVVFHRVLPNLVWGSGLSSLLLKGDNRDPRVLFQRKEKNAKNCESASLEPKGRGHTTFAAGMRSDH